jgi:uncharacterized membrane protein
MRSRFAIAGHPIHPMLVALPIGLLSWSFVALLVYVASDENQTWYDISYYSAIAGVVTALVAAVPGFVDGWTLARGTSAQPLAIAHMALNLTTVGVFALACLLMHDDGAVDGGQLGFVVALQALGMSMLGIAGWLGGEMVFRHHLAVLPEGWEAPLTASTRSARLRPHVRGR